MKKSSKRLDLSRETLAAMEGGQLPRAAAGYSTPNGCTHPCPVTLTCVTPCI